jgi:chromosome segregation ATPase
MIQGLTADTRDSLRRWLDEATILVGCLTELSTENERLRAAAAAATRENAGLQADIRDLRSQIEQCRSAIGQMLRLIEDVAPALGLKERPSPFRPPDRR